MIKLLVLASVFLFALINAAPCGRCIPLEQRCGGETDQCSSGTTCAVLENGVTPLCLPTVKSNDRCEVTSYDNCPAFFSCDEGVCKLNNNIGDLNDACNDDNSCKGAMECLENKCQSSTDCTVGGCPVHQYCDVDAATPVCTDKPVVGAQCTANGPRCFLSSCIAQECIELFTHVAGADCNRNEDCVPGLLCGPDNECYKPNYRWLTDGFGAYWGEACDTEDGETGCTCNYPARQEQFLLEVSAAYRPACPQVWKNYWECMRDNNCAGQNTFEGACMRDNCYSQFVAMRNECVDQSLLPPRCTASTFMIGFSALLAILL